MSIRRRLRHFSCPTPVCNRNVRSIMFNWFNCRVSGRHEYGVWCEPGAIFLRCVHCSRRSSGWAVDPGSRRQAGAMRVTAPAPAAESPSHPRRVAAGARLEVLQNRVPIKRRAEEATRQPKPATGARVLAFVRKQEDAPDHTELRQAG